MRIDRKIRKKIKTISLMSGDYPGSIDISEEEFEELKAYLRTLSAETIYIDNDLVDNYIFEGVRLNVK